MARPVSAPPAGRMINSATAAALAAQRGTPINMNSLLVATRRGNIQGAVKVKGRWKFPYWAFEDWLIVHVERADYDPNNA